MNISRQWTDRLRIWAAQFDKHFISESTPLTLSFFTTMDQLAYDEALQGDFAPVPAGMKWGHKWEYGWFRTGFTVPETWAGQRLVLQLRAGEEMLVWVNGQEAGAIDKKHSYITLTRCARPGDHFDIVAECYAGHGVRNEGAGPVGPDEETVPEPPEKQVTVGTSTVAVWNETVYQAAMDYRTLFSLVQKLPDRSLRAMKIVKALKQFTLIADFELPEEALTRSVAEAARVLQPALQCTNGSTAPEYTIFGQSHLDMAWLWPVDETLRKTARTYSNQLALMEEYPEYQFLLCEPPILETLKALYPNVYHRVQEKFAQGAFIPEGALWIESDTNIPSGESLIRQFVRGKRWFRQEMNVDSRMAWMPDTFGFSAVLPQIMKKCGVPYFATQKLLRQDPEAEPFPYNVFWWEGLDGSRVLSHVYKKNNANFDAGDLITRWEQDRNQQEDIDGLMYPFGFGDGGGGPTRDMLETVRRCRDLEGAPRCRMESPVRFFERQHDVSNVYRGELYLAWHRGTLTSQARTKRGIRKAEVALKQAEYLMAQCMLRGEAIPDACRDKLQQALDLLLFNQFHDIAPGTSIARVHARAESELQQAVHLCDEIRQALLPDDRAMIHNPHGWDVCCHGQTVPAQGCIPLSDAPIVPRATLSRDGDGYILRNDRLICRVNGQGEITSVQDASGWEYLSGAGNRLLLYKDVNTCYDAWEIGSMTEDVPVPLSGDVRITPCEDADGAALLVERMVASSPMTQKIRLTHDGQRIDFITRIDWHERHKLLKVAFPTSAYTSEALHEIQFGYVKRPTHRSRQHDRDQYEVCNHRYTVLEDGGHGAAVLNDCKYGVSTRDSEIRLTLLKAPLMPDMTADQGEQHFTYAFCPFEGDFRRSDVLRQATELNEPLMIGGGLTRPIILSSQRNIVVDTLKPADTVANAILVRAYEAMGQKTDAAFTLADPIRRVEETDMLETQPCPLPHENGLHVTFAPFEIKTFLLHL